MTQTTDVTKPNYPKAVAEEVAEILRDRIVKGELAPFDRIIERRLSAELNVSRTPIREALKLLESDQLITISLHRGAHVLEYVPEEAKALFDVISVLEGLAARRLAEVITCETLQLLEDLHGQMLEFHSLRNATAYFDINTIIHDLIVNHCGNPVLTTNHARLIARARRGRYLAIVNPKRLIQAVGEHEAIMQAFRARDPETAATVWETHLRHTGDTVANVLRKTQANSRS